MEKGSNAAEAQLAETLDALTVKALHETLDFLEQESSKFEKSCTIALSGKATYALSRPQILEKFKRMLADRLRPRYLRGKKFDLKRAEREWPRLEIIRGPVNLLSFKIGGTPEEIAREIGSAPLKRIPAPAE